MRGTCNTLQHTATHCNTLQQILNHAAHKRHLACISPSCIFCNAVIPTPYTLYPQPDTRHPTPWCMAYHQSPCANRAHCDAFVCVMCDLPHAHVVWPHSCVIWRIRTWHGLFICDMTQFCVTWLIDMWHDSCTFDMPHSCVARLILTWHGSCISIVSKWQASLLLIHRLAHQDCLLLLHIPRQVSDYESTSHYTCKWAMYKSVSPSALSYTWVEKGGGAAVHPGM
jgi:hypothetical protein